MGIETMGNQNSAPTTLGAGQSTLGGGLGSLNLTKGEKLNLTKTAPGLTEVMVGLGWDVNAGTGADFDLDAQVVLLGENGKARSQADLIFFNNLRSSCGSVVHQGDNRTGAGDGDDEKIVVTLAQVPQDVQKMAFLVNIHEAVSRRQNFGQVSNAYIRLVDNLTGAEIARFDLTEDYSTSISVIMGELYRHNGEWRFNASGQGRTEDLEGLCRLYGVL